MRRLVEQQKEIDDLLRRVEALRIRRRNTPMSGDRIDYSFVESIQFRQQENVAQNIVFSIPQETDYVAERLSFYPSYRFVTTDEAGNGPPEISFRPCIFSSYEGAFNPFVETDSTAGAVDCFIDISENYIENGKSLSRRYQNLPTPVEMFYSGAVNYRQGGFQGGSQDIDDRYDGFEFPSTMVFPCSSVQSAMLVSSTMTSMVRPRSWILASVVAWMA